MITPEFGTPTSFDDADRAVSFPLQKLQSSKVVVLGAKKLETGKEVRVVLPEEKYLGRLQEIIVRDYFPELPKLKAQREYLDAVAANDLTKIRELQLRYSTKRTIRRTSPIVTVNSPGVFDSNTPGPSFSYAESKVEKNDERTVIKRKRTQEEKLTVDTYLNKFTSEDNASFEELALLHKKKEQIRNSWMYEAEKKHNEQFVTRGNELVKAADEQLMISSAPGATEKKPKELDNWSYKARNIVHFHPEEAPLTLEEHLQREKANQRIINKSATRFPEMIKEKRQITAMKGASQQVSVNPGKVDITGREAVHKAGAMELIGTPSPAPGVDESPFMTWGEIEGTPFRLDASDMATSASAPAFKIPEMPVREKIAQSIAETIARRYHDKRKIAMRQVEKHHTRTPSFGSIRTSEKLTTMSPAARRLAAHGLGIRLSSDKEWKINYTPSPSRTSHPICLTGTPGSLQLLKKTPKINAESVNTSPNTNSSITDNLLTFGQSSISAVKKIRPSAVDFF
uniref:Uncharacterized protein n=1 Tax=Setaria digitata TaxID=48799 RepID=A0A915PIB1_9BILA